MTSPAPQPQPRSGRRLQDLLAQQEARHDSPPARRLQLCTYNIQDARNSRLEGAIRNLSVQNIDVGILTELRIPQTSPIHTRSSQGYTVYATYTTRMNQGGIGLVFRQQSVGWSLESIQRHGPNVLSCYLIIGSKRQPLIGVYLPPSSLDDLPSFTEALDRFSSGHRHPPIVLGDLNVDLSNTAATDAHGTASAFISTAAIRKICSVFLRKVGSLYRGVLNATCT